MGWEDVEDESEHGWLLGRIDDPFGDRWEIGKPLGDWPPATYDVLESRTVEERHGESSWRAQAQ